MPTMPTARLASDRRYCAGRSSAPGESRVSGLRNSSKSASDPRAPWLHAAAKPRFSGLRITTRGNEAGRAVEGVAEGVDRAARRIHALAGFEVARLLID